MTAYAKSSAREKGLVAEESKIGLLCKPERVILISLSLLLGIFNLSFVLYPIIALALLSNFTALQRIYLNLKGAKSSGDIGRIQR